MQGDVLRAGVEKLGHLRLGQPNRLIFKAALDAGAAVFALIQDKGRLGRGGFGHGGGLKVPAEGLVEEGFFQGVEGGEFALVDGFQTFGFVE